MKQYLHIGKRNAPTTPTQAVKHLCKALVIDKNSLSDPEKALNMHRKFATLFDTAASLKEKLLSNMTRVKQTIQSSIITPLAEFEESIATHNNTLDLICTVHSQILQDINAALKNGQYQLVLSKEEEITNLEKAVQYCSNDSAELISSFMKSCSGVESMQNLRIDVPKVSNNSDEIPSKYKAIEKQDSSESNKTPTQDCEKIIKEYDYINTHVKDNGSTLKLVNIDYNELIVNEEAKLIEAIKKKIVKKEFSTIILENIKYNDDTQKKIVRSILENGYLCVLLFNMNIPNLYDWENLLQKGKVSSFKMSRCVVKTMSSHAVPNIVSLNCPNLHSLCFNHSYIDNNSLLTLDKALSKNKYLRKLELSDCNFDDHGIEALKLISEKYNQIIFVIRDHSKLKKCHKVITD